MYEFDSYLSQLRSLLEVGPRRTQEICEEVRCHLEAQTRALQRSGLGREEAAAQAMRAFGEPKAVARLLAAANSQHHRQQVLRALALGVSIGPPILYLGSVVDYLVRHVTLWGITDGWYVTVLTGSIIGGLCALAVAHWRVRLRWFLAAWLSGPAVLAGWVIWLHFSLRGPGAGAVAMEVIPSAGLPAVLSCAALAVGVAWAVHRWVLAGPDSQPTPTAPGGELAGPSRWRREGEGARMRGRRGRGYILLELLVVCGLIAALAAILATTYGHALRFAREKTCASSLHQLMLAVQMYQEDYGGVPPQELGQLVPWYCSRDLLICPEDQVGGYESTVLEGARAGQRAAETAPTSYFYAGRDLPESATQAGLPLPGTWWRSPGGQASAIYLACVLHGHQVAGESWSDPSRFDRFYNGRVLQVRGDGSVTTRAVDGYKWLSPNVLRLLACPLLFNYDCQGGGNIAAGEASSRT
jgi:type II secretory pathway pseudopilin PulG